MCPGWRHVLLSSPGKTMTRTGADPGPQGGTGRRDLNGAGRAARKQRGSKASLQRRYCRAFEFVAASAIHEFVPRR